MGTRWMPKGGHPCQFSKATLADGVRCPVTTSVLMLVALQNFLLMQVHKNLQCRRTRTQLLQRVRTQSLSATIACRVCPQCLTSTLSPQLPVSFLSFSEQLVS